MLDLTGAISLIGSGEHSYRVAYWWQTTISDDFFIEKDNCSTFISAGKLIIKSINCKPEDTINSQRRGWVFYIFRRQCQMRQQPKLLNGFKFIYFWLKSVYIYNTSSPSATREVVQKL